VATVSLATLDVRLDLMISSRGKDTCHMFTRQNLPSRENKPAHKSSSCSPEEAELEPELPRQNMGGSESPRAPPDFCDACFAMRMRNQCPCRLKNHCGSGDLGGASC
jgi:hypothetical protein